jgi:hypothetical protein
VNNNHRNWFLFKHSEYADLVVRGFGGGAWGGLHRRSRIEKQSGRPVAKSIFGFAFISDMKCTHI